MYGRLLKHKRGKLQALTSETEDDCRFDFANFKSSKNEPFRLLRPVFRSIMDISSTVHLANMHIQHSRHKNQFTCVLDCFFFRSLSIYACSHIGEYQTITVHVVIKWPGLQTNFSLRLRENARYDADSEKPHLQNLYKCQSSVIGRRCGKHALMYLRVHYGSGRHHWAMHFHLVEEYFHPNIKQTNLLSNSF